MRGTDIGLVERLRVAIRKRVKLIARSRRGAVITIFSEIPACFLSVIIAFAENLGRWGLKSEVTLSRAVTRNNYFDSPLRAYPGFVSHWPKRGCDFSMGICAIRKLHLPFASLFSVTLSTTIKSNATVIR